MDVAGGIAKVASIVQKVNEYNEKLKTTINPIIEKINGYIDELDRVINKLKELGEKAIAWVQMQIKKIFNKINEALDAVKQKFSDILGQIDSWINDNIKRIKISTIKAASAKMGLPLTDEAAEAMSGLIVTPPITLPELTLPEFNLPEINASVDMSFFDSIKLEKLPLL